MRCFALKANTFFIAVTIRLPLSLLLNRRCNCNKMTVFRMITRLSILLLLLAATATATDEDFVSIKRFCL